MRFDETYKRLEEKSSLGIRIRALQDDILDAKERRKKMIVVAKERRALAYRAKDNSPDKYRQARDSFKDAIENIEDIEDRIAALKEKIRELKSQTTVGRMKKFIRGE